MIINLYDGELSRVTQFRYVGHKVKTALTVVTIVCDM